VGDDIENDASYRITGFYRDLWPEQIRVFELEYLGPPIPWFTGETVRVVRTPGSQLGVLPVPGHEFSSPRGTLELWLPPDTLASTRRHALGPEHRNQAGTSARYVQPVGWQNEPRPGNMRSCIPIETSRPMRGARHCGLNASCCGVGAPKT